MMANNISIPVLFTFIFTTTFMVHLGEAVGNDGNNVASGGTSHDHHNHQEVTVSRLNNLTEKEAEFYNRIIVPMLNYCPIPVTKSYGKKFHGAVGKIKDKFVGVDLAKKHKKRLCATVGSLDKLFIELDREYKMKAAWNRLGLNREETEENVDKILEQIHGVITADFSELHKEYGHLLGMKADEKIVKEVGQIAETKRAHLNTDFVQTFGQLIEELKNCEKPAHKGEEPIVQNRNSAAASVAFRLVCIGQQMASVFNKNVVEKQEWAYQQYAVNMALHSFYLDKPDENILIKSIESWPIGMIECPLIEQDAAKATDSPTLLSNLAGKDQEFYNLIIVPLVPKCVHYILFTVKQKELLCERVIELYKLFMELNERNKMATLGTQKTQEAALTKIHDIKWRIRVSINVHAMMQLMEVYKRQLVNLADPIETEVDAIPAPKRVNLNKAFKQTYEEWKTEMGAKNRPGQTDDKYTYNSKGYRIALSDQITFKLLYIGHQMFEEFREDAVKDDAVNEAALQCAYQQFAVCLRIHSVRLAPQIQEGEFANKLEIIAESWPEIGIKIEEQEEEEEEDKIEPSMAIAAVPKDTN